MYNVILENENKEQLDLMNCNGMVCVSIDGIAGMSATINETENAILDGSVINSERLNSRTINISVRVYDNCGECREQIYRYAVVKKPVKLYLTNDIRSVYINGVVKSVDSDLFTSKETMTITIVCSEPYFNEITSTENEFSEILPYLWFEFATDDEGIPFGVIGDTIQSEINNTGESDTGVIFTLKAKGEVVNPQIVDMATGEYFKLDYTMKDEETITINTISKQKSIISRYNNVETDILSYRDKTSTWLIASVGSTTFTYSQEGTGELELTCTFQNRYLGV